MGRVDVCPLFLRRNSSDLYKQIKNNLNALAIQKLRTRCVKTPTTLLVHKFAKCCPIFKILSLLVVLAQFAACMWEVVLQLWAYSKWADLYILSLPSSRVYATVQRQRLLTDRIRCDVVDLQRWGQALLSPLCGKRKAHNHWYRFHFQFVAGVPIRDGGRSEMAMALQPLRL